MVRVGQMVMNELNNTFRVRVMVNILLKLALQASVI